MRDLENKVQVCSSHLFICLLVMNTFVHRAMKVKGKMVKERKEAELGLVLLQR